MSPATTTHRPAASTAGDWPPTTSPRAATAGTGSPRAATADTGTGGDAKEIVDARMASMPSRDATMRDLVAALLSAAVTEIVRRVPGIVGGEDVEAVHQARVATRRLRAQLRMLRPVVNRQWADETRSELKWLAQCLGAVRDADVLYAELDEQQRTLPQVDRAAARVLSERVLAERREAHDRLVEELQSDRYRALMDRLLDATAVPPMRGRDHRADGSAESVLPELVAKRYRGLARRVSKLGEDPSDEALHEVRKQSKSLRYVAEASRPFVGSPAKRLARAAERLQDVLGEVHDAAAAQAWLRHQVLLTPRASTGLAAGSIVNREWERYRVHHGQWRHAWKRLHRKKVRRWLG